MSSSNCCFLTCMQISQEAGKVVWYSHLLQNFPQFVVIQIVRGFSIVNEVEVGAFLKFPRFFHEPTDVDNLTSGSSAFSESSLYIWKFSVGVLLKPSLENFQHYLHSIWDECNYAVVWALFGIAFLWDWNENGLFPLAKPKRTGEGDGWNEGYEGVIIPQLRLQYPLPGGREVWAPFCHPHSDHKDSACSAGEEGSIMGQESLWLCRSQQTVENS